MIESLYKRRRAQSDSEEKTSQNRFGQPYFDNKRNTITYNALARIKKRVEHT
jgi:hypothetical protein